MGQLYSAANSVPIFSAYKTSIRTETFKHLPLSVGLISLSVGLIALSFWLVSFSVGLIAALGVRPRINFLPC